MRPPRLGLAVGLLLVALAPALVRPEAASACYGGPAPEVLNPAGFTQYADAIIVGEVAREEEWRDRPGIYASTVRVEATLLGDVDEEVVLPALGVLQGDCSGGQRLPEGERVLLFLERLPDNVNLPQARWQIAIMGYGLYSLVDGKALLDRNPYRHDDAPPPPLPWQSDVERPAEDVIREVATLTAADPTEVDRALRFAIGSPPDNRGLIALMVAAASAVAVLGIARWRHRRRAA
ncbi:MAG: hypothetical protein M0R73_12855 [Dehalococcoidia bacterium]|nr:hypothetical protein [Dehalococcoidia bacterium]